MKHGVSLDVVPKLGWDQFIQSRSIGALLSNRRNLNSWKLGKLYQMKLFSIQTIINNLKWILNLLLFCIEMTTKIIRKCNYKTPTLWQGELCKWINLNSFTKVFRKWFFSTVFIYLALEQITQSHESISHHKWTFWSIRALSTIKIV